MLSAGSLGGRFRPDPLSRRVYQRRAGYENKPNRGPCPGERLSTTVPMQTYNLMDSITKSAQGAFGQRKQMKPLCHFRDAL